MSQLPTSIEIGSLQRSIDNINVQQSGVTGVNTYSPNSTNGTSVTALKNTNSTQSGLNAIQSTISSGLADAGFTSTQINSLTNNIVSDAVNKKNSLADSATDSTAGTGKSGTSNVKSSKSNPDTEAEKARKAQGEGAGESMMFPANLENAAHTYLKLKFLAYKRTDAQSEGTTGPAGDIYLPLPENFQQDLNVSYDTQETGATGAIREQMMESFEGADSAGEKALAGLETALSGGAAVVGRAAFAAADSGPLPSLGSVIQQEMGQIYNPHPSVFFKGLPLRSFNFSWKLVPLDKDDASNLKKIIDEIKFKILPSVSDDFMVYPDLLEIKIEGRGAEQYGVFKTMFVETFSVNYTGEGTSAFFNDGSPVSIALSMQLREAELFTREDVREGS